MRKKDDEKARSIKAAVVKMILQEGFHGASISKIAKMAGVSPATVYIYFENKENMLQDIYREYSEDIFAYLLDGVKKGMDGHQFIDLLVRSYYNYMLNHKEVFNYVEQFSNCPSLVNGCSGRKGVSKIYNLIEEMKKNHIMKDYSNEILLAMIFSPVKAIAIDAQKSEAERSKQLQELITIIQDAVLTEPPKSAIIVQK
jgi:AcrR family transcriptional regulator